MVLHGCFHSRSPILVSCRLIVDPLHKQVYVACAAISKSVQVQVMRHDSLVGFAGTPTIDGLSVLGVGS